MRFSSWLDHPKACSEADMAPSAPRLDVDAIAKALTKRDEADLGESALRARVKVHRNARLQLS